MTRIGVISDTHLKGYDRYLDDIIEAHFSDVDMFIHAGDMVRSDVLDPFYATGKEIYAVAGNMDPVEVQSRYASKRVIHVENIKIGIIHGWGSPAGIRQRIAGEFPGCEAVVYGHTHQPFCGYEANIFFFNPGSPTDSRFTSYNSVGIIKVDGNAVGGEIIRL